MHDWTTGTSPRGDKYFDVWDWEGELIPKGERYLILYGRFIVPLNKRDEFLDWLLDKHEDGTKNCCGVCFWI